MTPQNSHFIHGHTKTGSGHGVWPSLSSLSKSIFLSCLVSCGLDLTPPPTGGVKLRVGQMRSWEEGRTRAIPVSQSSEKELVFELPGKVNR